MTEALRNAMDPAAEPPPPSAPGRDLLAKFDPLIAERGLKPPPPQER